ncbi:MAG: hypothetical protein ACOC1K_04820 [Nanoarchaeota archaeon]
MAEKNNSENKRKEDEYEYCVSCGKKTGYKKSTPVDKRACYERGVGQLCAQCCKELRD